MKSVVPILLATCAIAVQPSQAQQTTSDVLTILRASLAAQAGQQVIQDVTLTGNVESIAGSDDETVPFSFKGTLSASARTDINLSSGTLTEIRTVTTTGPAGVWSSGDGPQKSIAGQNLMTDPAWCSPVLIIERLLSNSAITIAYIGTEAGLAHFRATQASPAGTLNVFSGLVEHLGQIDLYLDPKTFLPVKLLFSTHPDNDALVDLPVAISYSNFQTTSGVNMPMHIQRYLNGTLALDVQIRTGAVNSGIPASAFQFDPTL